MVERLGVLDLPALNNTVSASVCHRAVRGGGEKEGRELSGLRCVYMYIRISIYMYRERERERRTERES